MSPLARNISSRSCLLVLYIAFSSQSLTIWENRLDIRTALRSQEEPVERMVIEEGLVCPEECDQRMWLELFQEDSMADLPWPDSSSHSQPPHIPPPGAQQPGQRSLWPIERTINGLIPVQVTRSGDSFIPEDCGLPSTKKSCGTSAYAPLFAWRKPRCTPFSTGQTPVLLIVQRLHASDLLHDLLENNQTGDLIGSACSRHRTKIGLLCYSDQTGALATTACGGQTKQPKPSHRCCTGQWHRENLVLIIFVGNDNHMYIFAGRAGCKPLVKVEEG